MGTLAHPRIRYGEGDTLRLRVEVLRVVPQVWRRLLVSSRASLLELHAAIQQALGQAPSAEHRFVVDGVEYHDPEGAEHPARATDCAALASLDLDPGARLLHEVANGTSGWEYIITVEEIAPRLVGQRIPVCLAGGGAAPPDDCDGPERYAELLAALADPHDPWAAELREWLPQGFDPEYVDLNSVNARLARLPKHRPAA